MKMKNERKPHHATRKNLTTLKKETRNDTSMTTKTKHDDEYVNKGHELAEKCGKKYNLPSTCITKKKQQRSIQREFKRSGDLCGWSWNQIHFSNVRGQKQYTHSQWQKLPGF